MRGSSPRGHSRRSIEQRKIALKSNPWLYNAANYGNRRHYFSRRAARSTTRPTVMESVVISRHRIGSAGTYLSAVGEDPRVGAIYETSGWDRSMLAGPEDSPRPRPRPRSTAVGRVRKCEGKGDGIGTEKRTEKESRVGGGIKNKRD